MIFKKEIEKILSKHGIKEAELTIPPNTEMGDLSLPCFKLSKEAPKFAQELAAKIKPSGLLFKAVALGPYVNFYADNEKLASKLLPVILDNDFSAKKTKQKALIEHTSINPNAEPHVGRARNAIIGDSISRVLRHYGYNLTVHYFVNDIGKQIAMLVLATEKYNEIGLTFEKMLQMYVKINKEMENDAKIEEEVFALLQKLEQGDEKTVEKFRKIVSIAVKGQTALLSELGINFDVFDYESKYVVNNDTINKILKKLKPYSFTDDEGRTVLDLKQFNLPMKDEAVFVLTRSNGTSMYGLRDIAYTMDKAKLAKKNIVVLGEDQKLHFMQVASAVKLLGETPPEVVHYAFVSLKNGKMSTRQGNVVLLKEFVKEAAEKAREEIKKRNLKVKEEELEKAAKIIGYGAAKYAFLKISANRTISFDWEEALSFEGNSAPYLMYSAVRAQHILEKAGKASVPKKIVLSGEQDFSLVKKLYEFDDVIEKVSKDYQIHTLCSYAFELANAFSLFYEKSRVLNEENKDIRESRISLVRAYEGIISRTLYLLGLEVPSFM